MSSRIPFIELARQRVVVLDGAMGSNLQQRTFDLQKDWLNQENISEVLNFTRPEVIQEIHEGFLAVGCDAVETNTFGANKIVMAEAEMADRVYENNVAAAAIARRACDRYETPDRGRYVVGAAGGGTKLLTLGMTDWTTAEESYFEQFRGLIDGGSDVLLFETQQDLLIIKVMLVAAERAFAHCGRRLPIIVQASFDQDNGNQMLTGSDAGAFVAAMASFDAIDALGLNCAFGPNELTQSVRAIADGFPRLVSALPNAGMPVMVDGKTHFPMQPVDFAVGIERFVKEFGVNIVGGCCGTMAEHLAEVVKRVGVPNEGNWKDPAPASQLPTTNSQLPPAGVRAKERNVRLKPQISSLVSAEDIRQDLSYLIVAERTNTNGSKKFRTLLQAEDFDALVSMGRDEMRDGSHMLDVCVDFVGRDGVRDMREVVRRFVNAIPAPLMLDSTDPKVLEAGLQLAGGRCVLNSMNLEEGEEKLGQFCRLAKTYGAAVVAGTIDEDKLNAMARTRERKLAIAQRIRDIAVERHGLTDEDLLFDPLVLPISTGIEEDRRNALETIEGTRLISQHLPRCHTVVGLSNVSFGLKPAARVVLNSAFLHELRDAGLTGAIVHASKILPKNRIPQEQWDAALELIYDKRKENHDPLTHFIGLFTDDTGLATSVARADPWEGLTIEEALKKHIIDGEKRDLVKRLEEARVEKRIPPLEIINNVLLEGMKVVGELFGRGEMQLPFVLQSAETMKAAVAHLEPFMEKLEGNSKGRIVLATVKGDVHDIGKNLVDIILTNNGYTVFNLGIKQPVADILRAAEEKNADAIGMSGLLVKSVAVMKENLEELNLRGIKTPVLLGGAALTRDYAEDDLANLYKGPLLYCRDAFDGLKVMDYVSGKRIDALYEEQRERAQKRKTQRANAVKPLSGLASEKPKIDHTNQVPVPPFWGRRVVTGIKPGAVFPFINEIALFTGQWGLKRKGMSEEAYDAFLDQHARPVFRDLVARAATESFIEPKVVYGYFPVQADGNDLIVYRAEDFQHEAKCDCGACGHALGQAHGSVVGIANGKLIPRRAPREHLRFSFPRQQGRRELCISDFYRTKASGEYDVLALQLVTVGDKATELAEALRHENRYQDYLYLHGFGVESAEALAELWHKRVRQELGFGAEDDPDVRRTFQQHYRGSRYSFGYPACPNLEDRAKIVELLRPEEINVVLSENYMLVPEQSTDAIVAHHPQAKYFDVD
ncbi:MAG TPA: homocysteine S-methyltransferase family protein [Tepidisphaeraceae bacterium]